MNNLVVLVSGGIDSYVAYRYAVHLLNNNIIVYDKIIPLFVNYGQPYLKKEQKAIDSLYGENLISVKADLVSAELDNVPTTENQEIYGRNTLLAVYGAMLGGDIWLSVLETERSKHAVFDKQPTFFNQINALLTFTMQHKRDKTSVTSPFFNRTKSDIVKLALEIGVTKEELLKTSTCYHIEHNACGECSTCFKRWISLVNNGIQEEYYAPIMDNKYGKQVMYEMSVEICNTTNSGRFTDKRKEETSNALLAAKLPELGLSWLYE